MRKLILLLFALSAIQYSSAQKQTITLNEAVLNQYSKYHPVPQRGLEFLPSGEKYIYQGLDKDSNSAVIIGESENGNETIWFSFEQLQTWCRSINQEIKRIPRFSWLDDHRAIFRLSDGNYAMLDISKNTVELYGSLPKNAEEITFNSDFSACAFVLDDNIFIWTKGDEIKQITIDGSESIVYGKAVHRSEFGINEGLYWSKNGQKLAFYRMDQSMVTQYPLVHISSIPATTETIRYPMAGQASHHVTVGIADIKGNEAVYIQSDGDPEQYLTAVTFSPTANSIYVGVLNRDQNHLLMNRYSSQTGEFIETLFQESSKTYVEPERALHFYSGEEEKAIWFSEKRGHEHMYLYSKKFNEGLAMTFGLYDVLDIIGYDNKSKTLMYSATGEVVKTPTHINFDRNATQSYTYLHKDPFGGGAKILDNRIGSHTAVYTSNSQYIIEHFSSLEIPLETTIYSIDGKKIKTIYSAKDPMADLKIGKSELFSITAGNGDPLFGRLVKPSDFDPLKKYPVLVYVYGGPHAQLVKNTFNAGASLWMNWFAEQGYIVATIDNRGSAHRGQAFEEETFRHLGQKEMEDQMELVRYLKNQPWTNKNQFAIHGWSFGGFMTINLLLNHPGTFNCGIAGGPVCDWSMYEVMYTERYMDTPESNPAGFENTNLVNQAGKLKDDLLIIHGTADNVVVWQHSQAFVKACIESDVQVDYFIYPEHEHNVRGKDRAHLMTKVLNYVDEHIEKQ